MNLAGNSIVVLGVEVDITAVLESVPGALAAGMEVEVSDSFSAGVLTATEVEADDEHEGSDD